jgi:tetratricopeptide (TPR) repeat protein
MGVELPAEAEVLLRRVEEAVGAEGVRLTPLLVQLARVAPPHSRAWAYAHSLLAERLVATEPWRASLLARRAVEASPDDDLGWGVLGLAQSLLGNPGYAVAAYRRALDLVPHNPWYAHNLGHLYDVALHRPEEAIGWLRRAHRALPDHPDVVASYAHALVRAGEPRRARELMAPLMRDNPSPQHHALYRYIVERHDDTLAELIVAQQHQATRPWRKRRHTGQNPPACSAGGDGGS